MINKLKKWLSYNSPNFATAEEWHEFEMDMKKNAPLRFKMKRLSIKLGIFKNKIKRIKLWVRYRTIRKMHIVNTGLSPGYYDTDILLLNTAFQLLVDHVEIRLAWQQLWSERPSFWQIQKMKWRKRDKTRGLKYLEWAMALDHPYDAQQAEAAKKIMSLYMWWTKIRPNRKDVPSIEYDYEKLTEDYGLLFILSDKFKKEQPDLYLKITENHKSNFRLADTYYTIDNVMFKQLIDIRQTLWD